MRKVFLDDLPRWEKGEGAVKVGTINWNKSIGYKVPFIYDNIEDKIEIIDYINDRSRVIISYKDKQMNIFSGSLKEGNIGKLFNKITKDFKIEIGTIFKDDKKDLIIIDREYRKKSFIDKEGYNCVHNLKWYKYECNKCSYEGWIIEYDLLKGKGCSCCNGKTVVPEINSIWVKEPWMMNLGVSEEDAKKYTPGSSKKIKVKCPDCGRYSNKICRDVFKYKTIRCACGDGFSYPEKFMANTLNQLGVEFIMQLSKTTFKWCRNYLYDFYIPSLNIIIETHGSQHYEEPSRGRSLAEEQENDRYKEQLAKENGIGNYIVIDCRYSELEWVKNNILNSRLNELFDLSVIDWIRCEEYALKNIVKEVCEYWKNKEEWETTSDIQKIFGLSRYTVLKYLKIGNDNKWCFYNSDNSRKYGYIKASQNNKNKFSKPVEIFKDNVSLGVFESASELSRQSKERFGIKMIRSSISAVCVGKRKSHKGYIFKYISKEECEEYLKSQEII